MLSRAEYIKILIFIVAIAIITLVQLLTAETLSKMSVNIIISLQKDNYLVTSMQFITLIGSKLVKLLMLCITFATCNSYHAFMYSLVTYTSMFACSFLKINLQQPRPFWLSDQISAIECEYGYGYPSNHVLTTVPAFLVFYEVMYYRFELDKTVNKKIYYWLGMSTISFLCILIGFSRLVMGVHSLDQILFGLVMGFAFYFFFLDIIDFDLKNPTPFFNILFQDYGFYKMVFIYSSTFFLFFLNSIWIGDDYDPIWTDRIINTCGYMPYLTPFFKCFTDVCDLFMLTGITAGIVYESKMRGTKNLDEYVTEYIAYKDHKRIGKWNDTDFLTSFIRIVISFVECNFLMIIFGFISHFLDMGLITHLLFVKVLPLTLIGFIMFGLFKKQFDYMKLTNIPESLL